MAWRRWRTKERVLYADTVIPEDVVLVDVDPEIVPGWAGKRIREQVTEGLAKPQPGQLAPTPVRVIQWAGKYRTIPEAFLEELADP
jgi:hypothetical protein